MNRRARWIMSLTAVVALLWTTPPAHAQVCFNSLLLKLSAAAIIFFIPSLLLAADYGNSSQSFNNPRRVISGMTIGLPVHTIASSLDDPDVKVTAELLNQNGNKPTDGIRPKIINGAIVSLKMTTSHELCRTSFEIDASGSITKQ